MSVQSQITRLKNNVAASLQAVAAKGVTVSEDATSDDLPSLIAEIVSGGGDINGKNFVCGQVTLASSTTSSIVLAKVSDLSFTINGNFTDKVAVVWCNPQDSYSSNLVFAGRICFHLSGSNVFGTYFKLNRANSVSNSAGYPIYVSNGQLYLGYNSSYPFYVGVTYSWLIIDVS